MEAKQIAVGFIGVVAALALAVSIIWYRSNNKSVSDFEAAYELIVTGDEQKLLTSIRKNPSILQMSDGPDRTILNLLILSTDDDLTPHTQFEALAILIENDFYGTNHNDTEILSRTLAAFRISDRHYRRSESNQIDAMATYRRAYLSLIFALLDEEIEGAGLNNSADINLEIIMHVCDSKYYVGPELLDLSANTSFRDFVSSQLSRLDTFSRTGVLNSKCLQAFKTGEEL